MRTARTILPLTVTAIMLSACGGNPGGPDAQHPDPGDCRVTVSSDISSPTVFTNGPGDCDYFFPGSDTVQNYRVTSDMRVEPGTVLRFGENATLYVVSGGSLTAVGTAAEPIVFEGAAAVDGYWHGLCFEQNRESRLDHVHVRWAGSTWVPSGSACRGSIAGSYPAGDPVHITNSTVAGSYVSGLSAFNLVLGDFSNNAFYGNREYGVIVEAEQVSRLDVASDYLGADSGAVNGHPFVATAGHIWSGEHIWSKLNAPYFVPGKDYDYGWDISTEPGVTLVIDAGSELVFGEQAELGIDNGLFGLAGLPESPVVLRGLEESRGWWKGVTIFNSAVIMNDVRILFAGADDLFQGALAFQESGTDASGKQLNRVFIDGSAGCALRIDHDDLSLFDPLDVSFGDDNELESCL